MVKAMSPTSWHLTQCLHSHLDVYTFPPASFIANELSPYFMAIREFFWSFKIFDANWWSILVVFFWHLLDVCRTSIVDVHIMSEHRRPTDVWKLSWTVGQDLDVPWTSYGRPLHTGKCVIMFDAGVLRFYEGIMRLDDGVLVWLGLFSAQLGLVSEYLGLLMT